jgi:hypothetical protein
MARAKLRGYVGETREDLGATLDEIEHRLRPDVMAKKLGSWVLVPTTKTPPPGLLLPVSR